MKATINPTIDPNMSDIAIKVSNLHKSIQHHDNTINILKGLDLTINAHESVAIVGQSGSGKSTLLNVLAGLDQPQQGIVEVFGQDIVTLNEQQRASFRAKHTGFVFQSFYLLNDLTAVENIALPLELFGHKNPDKTAQHWLQKLGLYDRTNHFPTQLSGGEQQRVALGRAFALQPAILFADEPTANLDETTAHHIIEQLFDLHASSENCLILVTHDMKVAQKCQRVYHLTKGVLHESP